MYDVILNERKEKNIATRKWSTNHSHMQSLIPYPLYLLNLNN